MTVFIAGASTCPICEKVILSPNDAILIPTFILDRDHPLYKYSGLALHRPCFTKWNLRDQIICCFNEAYAECPTDDGRIYHMSTRGEIELIALPRLKVR
jgi:hypothetical protein